MTQDVGG